jgi:Fur family zinc uptake transcriptional regulator
LRQYVLEALLVAGRPLGAYDLLRLLGERLGRDVSPPTAYRALAFLQHHGFVKRLESCRSFVPTIRQTAPETVDETAGESGVFLICNSCGTTVEIDAEGLGPMLLSHARAYGFRVNHSSHELQGTCETCQSKGAKP